VHGSNATNLSVYLSSSQLAKMLCLSYYGYSSTKLDKMEGHILPGSEGVMGREGGEGGRVAK
jgi:hypothetical protein